MTEQIMVLLHGFIVLLFGVFLSASFANIPLNKKNAPIMLFFSVLTGALQWVIQIFVSEPFLWKAYPLITHLPLILFIVFFFGKRPISAIVSTFTAYLLCQPAKWFGVLTYSLSERKITEYCARIAVLLVVFVLTLIFLSRSFSEIFEKDTKSVCIFAIVPTVYYVFDYTTAVYTSIWVDNNRIAAEFLPFFLCIMFTVFCVVYYKEHEKKSDAERNEQIIRITVEEQAKELEAFKRSEREIKMLRHDLRLFLATLSVCVDTDDKATARDLINSYTEQVDRSKPTRFCANDTVNYVLSDFDAKCEAHEVKFVHSVGVENISVNEIMFSSILSNALDNALNAVIELPLEQRTVSLMLKAADGKLLLSVKNPISKKPVFSNGRPVSNQRGHGYGTQSIRYMTEKLGGNCQFTADDELFITRVII